jgi:hypothetical protein
VFPLDASAFERTVHVALSIRARRVHNITDSLHAGCRLSSAGGDLCRPPDGTTAGVVTNSSPWRERPRETAAWPVKPATTDVVAHATLKVHQRPCQRYQCVASVARTVHRVLRPNSIDLWSVFLRSLSDSDVNGRRREGAATKSDGWRTSGALSCQSKPMVDEPVSASAPLASLSTPTTCKFRGRTTNAAFCRTRNHLGGVTDGAGA